RNQEIWRDQAGFRGIVLMSSDPLIWERWGRRGADAGDRGIRAVMSFASVKPLPAQADASYRRVIERSDAMTDTNTDTQTDPRDKHPEGGFPAQEQEQPGLTDETRPEPDHGEDSYVGAGRLEGRKALITGGDS